MVRWWLGAEPRAVAKAHYADHHVVNKKEEKKMKKKIVAETEEDLTMQQNQKLLSYSRTYYHLLHNISHNSTTG